MIILKVYLVELDGLKLCFLGAIDTIDLPSEANEAIDEIDILFVPVSGKGTLSPPEAVKLAARLEPHLIIPMNYDKDTLKKFLDEAGEKNGSPLDKLTIKKKDMLGKEGEIVVLSPVSAGGGPAFGRGK